MESKKEACERVAKLVRELKGDRSIRKTAEDSGVAASYITGILNERYLPSADILRKLAALYAKPQNGVTLEDLMIAAGYQEDYVGTEMYQAFINNQGQLDIENAKVNHDMRPKKVTGDYELDFYEQKRQERRERQLRISKYETLATGIIYKSLVEKQMAFSNIENTVGIRGYKPDIVLKIFKTPILEWWFEFKHINRDSKIGGIHLGYLLTEFLFVEPKKERKITLVINDELLFDNLRGYKNKLAYKGDLSVILIDEENFAIVDEVYLAHYDDENMLSEFYLK